MENCLKQTWRAAPWLVANGVLLLASGVLHGVLLGVSGGAWEGALSWRKPMLFGLSGGVTALSLGWVLSWWQPSAFQRWNDRLLAWSLTAEVALISMQTWRGVASHFNRATPLDSGIYYAMGVLIYLATALVVILLVQSILDQRLAREVPADYLLSIRGGLFLLVVSCVLGIVATLLGERNLAQGLLPETYGKAGVLKFPHGVALHALQLLPVAAWLIRQAGGSVHTSLLVVKLLFAGQVLLLVMSCLQTFAGRSRWDFTPGTLALFVLAMGLHGALVLYLALLGLRRVVK
ncbi:MAG: hypothetical protein ACO1RA_02565 [Planctomycetaceae bacterium]